jgi:hypothetical protein
MLVRKTNAAFLKKQSNIQFFNELQIKKMKDF